MIKTHQISYNYSATLYKHLLKGLASEAKKGVLAVAPLFLKDRLLLFDLLKSFEKERGDFLLIKKKQRLSPSF